MQRTLIQFARYLLVGVVTYGVDIGVFLLLFDLLEIDLLMANMVSKVIAGVFSFLVHRVFTFSVNAVGGSTQQAVRYFTLLVLNIPLSSLILYCVMWIIPLEIAAKILSDVLLVLISFAQSKFIVFKAGGTSYD